jgi:hypothetical protein
MLFGVLAFTGTNAAVFGSTRAGFAPLTMSIPATPAANTVRAPFPSATPEIAMNTTPLFPVMDTLVKPFKFPATPYE